MEPGDLTKFVDKLNGLDSLLQSVEAGAAYARVQGLTGPASSLFLARVWQRTRRTMLVVTHNTDQVTRLLADLEQFGLPTGALYPLPAAEIRGYLPGSTDPLVTGERIAALNALAGTEPVVVVTTAEAALQHTGPPEHVCKPTFSLRVGQRVDLARLFEQLVLSGYQADTAVMAPGQFARRGGIVDIFPSTAQRPVRLEMFDDEIEQIREFEVASQLSTGKIDQTTIAPAREVRLDPERLDESADAVSAACQQRKMALAASGDRDAFSRLDETVPAHAELIRAGAYFDGLEEYLPYLVSRPLCALDYLSADAIAALDEPALIQAHWERTRTEARQTRERHFETGDLLSATRHADDSRDAVRRIATAFPTIALSLFDHSDIDLAPTLTLNVSTAAVDSYRLGIERYTEETKRWLASGADCLVISDQPHRLQQILADIGAPTSIQVHPGRLRQGFKFSDIGLFVATDADLFGATRALHERKRARGGVPVSTVLDLRPNDYVVHVHHGIGLYRGIVKRHVDGADRDYLEVLYTGGDKLFVPADQIDRIQRYSVSGEAAPQINSLYGSEWQRVTRKVKAQTKEIASELIQLYAAREAAMRPPLGPDLPWQAEMEQAFPYEETPSQLQAIHEVKEDLEGNRPMDRLVCGDVGFGKTEVALRAAFKVVQEGRQVAILCPTTVLAAQHHATFTERLSAYPLHVALLSRYRTAAEQRQTLRELEAGTVHIAVGTHRLLAKDVKFDNLGLVVVDEEQRFGVSHKELLKQMRKSVDVLTLSATPIPRTLSMALAGLRDLSIIDDPPMGRLPILTHVAPWNEVLVRDAISREMERDGQVFLVHNRIETIYAVAERVRRMTPGARVCVGHGQMDEHELEQIMLDFQQRKYDILLSTTIIENGLDLPNVNTILVDRADRMGLSQLYQLRGRVGRSNRQAYAYLFYRHKDRLTEQAEARLHALKSFSALGSGFQIAMRDLEIRGAGNLLGAEQHGAMVSVGYDLYCRLLAQAVAEEREEAPGYEPLPSADLPITAHIPGEYVPGEAERIYYYKRMAAVNSVADVEKIQSELEDRYGDPPKIVWTMLGILRLRLKAREAGIASIRGEIHKVTFKMAPGAHIGPDALKLLNLTFKGHRFTADSVQVPLNTAHILNAVDEMVGVIHEAVRFKAPEPARREPALRA